MGPTHRAFGATLMLTACLAFAACGDDDSDAGSSASSSANHGGLGAQRYDAIEALYKAALPLDKLADDAGGDALLTALRPYVRACGRLDRDDPLLAAQRRACAVNAKLARQSAQFSDCASDPTSCTDVLSRLPATVTQLVQAGRQADTAVSDAKLDGDCERGLQATKDDYATLEKIKQVFTLLNKALETNSTADANKAEQLSDDIADRKTASADLKRFRDGCG